VATAKETRHSGLGLDSERLLTMYRQMVLARAVDRRMWVLNRQGKAPFVISGQGHEAVQVAAEQSAASEQGVYSADEEAGILERLRDLGYE